MKRLVNISIPKHMAHAIVPLAFSRLFLPLLLLLLPSKRLMVNLYNYASFEFVLSMMGLISIIHVLFEIPIVCM